METDYKIVDGIPKLAAMLASSPLEAAVHDAFGQPEDELVRLHDSRVPQSGSRRYLGEEFSGKYPDEILLPKPRPPCRCITWWERSIR